MSTVHTFALSENHRGGQRHHRTRDHCPAPRQPVPTRSPARCAASLPNASIAIISERLPIYPGTASPSASICGRASSSATIPPVSAAYSPNPYPSWQHAMPERRYDSPKPCCTSSIWSEAKPEPYRPTARTPGQSRWLAQTRQEAPPTNAVRSPPRMRWASTTSRFAEETAMARS